MSKTDFNPPEYQLDDFEGRSGLLGDTRPPFMVVFIITDVRACVHVATAGRGE